MRNGVILLLALVLGCEYLPTEIGQFETSDNGETGDPPVSSVGVDWHQADLCKGKTVVAELGSIDLEVISVGAGVHPVVIEVAPIQPPTLPTGFVAEIHPLAGQATFEAVDGGLRYEGDLQFGWSLRLHADEQSIVEVRARIDEFDIHPNEDAASEPSCENEWLLHHPFWSCIWVDPPPQPDPGCGFFCNTYESSDGELGHAYCNMPCEGVGDCAAWDPGETVVSCDEGECRWYCEYDHDCPDELDCYPHVLMGLDEDPYWGRCMAPYPAHHYP